MPVLRLRQTSEGGDAYRVLLELEADGQRREDTRQFKFKLEAQDQEDLRWYLEDYLQYPLDPAPKIAARIEARMDEIGAELFGAVLAGAPQLSATSGESSPRSGKKAKPAFASKIES